MGVEVWSDGDSVVGGVDVDIEAVDEQQWRFVGEILCGAQDGDGAGFARDERDVVVRIKDGKDALAGPLSMQLQVNHERDGG